MELYHSDKYLGADYSDGIKHWKYVRREKLSNGKYRYFYKDKNDIVFTTDSKKDNDIKGGGNKYSKYTNVDQYGNVKTIQRKKGNNLIFGNRFTTTTDIGKKTETREIYYDSKLERSVSKGAKYVKKLFKKLKNFKLVTHNGRFVEPKSVNNASVKLK